MGKLRGQSSYGAIVGAIACIFLFAVAISYLSIDARLVAESYHRRELSNLAIVLSNDLLLNPGYPGHFGLALYDGRKRAVEEHFLDLEKVSGILEMNKTALKRQWGIENDFCVRVEEVESVGSIEKSGKRLGECPGGDNVYRVTRLGLMEVDGSVEVVKLVFDLYK